MKQFKYEKFDEDARTFETRLKFISHMFSNKHSKDEILAGCIQHKLDANMAIYEERLHRGELELERSHDMAKRPVQLLKKVEDKGEH